LFVVVLNLHAPHEERSDDSKDSSYGESKQALHPFAKYHMKSPSQNLNGKPGTEDIFEQVMGTESLFENSNKNGVRVVNFATPKKSNC
jgi:hypothetical protein